MGVTRCFSYGHIDMTTLIGTAISMGLMLPATTINHQPPRARIFHGIHDLILTIHDFIMPEI